MRRDEWARLAAPFPPHALDWRVAQLDREGSAARLEPVVSEAAVVERLDQVLGVDGWSVRLLPLGSDAVVCELALLGVHKSAVGCSFAGAIAMERVGGWALGRAAGLYGMHPPAARGAWVDFDLEAGEPVFLPEVEPDAVPGLAPDAAAGPVAVRDAAERDDVRSATTTASRGAGGDGEGVSAERVPEEGALSEDVPAESATVDGGHDERGSEESAAANGDAGAERSEGQQAIERLVDRLRADGLGREAAALVVEHGGYGRSAEEARELYRRLRELLLQKGAPS